MLKKILFTIILLINIIAFSQNTADQIATDVTLKIYKEISPNTGRSPSYEILSIDSENGYGLIDLKSTWIAKTSMWSDRELYFITHSKVYLNSYNQIVKVDVYYKNDAVLNAWSSSDVYGALAGLAVVGYAASSLNSDSNEKSTNSYSSNSYSSSSTKYSYGQKCIFEFTYKLPYGEGISGLLFKNSYTIRFYLQLKDSFKDSEGNLRYNAYCYDAEVGYPGNWISYNQIKGYEEAEIKLKQVMDKYKGQEVRPKEVDITCY